MGRGSCNTIEATGRRTCALIFAGGDKEISMQYTLATPQKLCWRLSDGRELDLGIGDEIDVDTSIPLLPRHRGLIYAVGDGTPPQVKVIHNNKGPGVEVVGWNDFSHGQIVRLLRRPSTPEPCKRYMATRACEHRSLIPPPEQL